LLLLAFGAFWANAFGAGYLTNPFGILFVFFAAVAWFKWESIRDGFDAAKGESQLPIIRLASKDHRRHAIFRRQPTRRSSSN
jgi:hypothetical protein